MPPEPCLPCQPVCESVFDRVVVSRVAAGGTTVCWQLLDTFTVRGPLTFQLEVSDVGGQESGDWTTVGDPVTDSYMAVDTEQRDRGELNRTFYRVSVTAGGETYRSVPVSSLGVLDRRDWAKARAIVREKVLSLRVLAGAPGYLLKPRRGGEPCPVCLDFQTGEPTRTDCPSCWGTGFACGYYYPFACVWAGLSPRSSFLKTDRAGMKPPSDPGVVRADMVLTDLLDSDDVWVHSLTDERYFVRRIDPVVAIRGVPLFGSVVLATIPYSSPLYRLPVPQRPPAGFECPPGLAQRAKA